MARIRGNRFPKLLAKRCRKLSRNLEALRMDVRPEVDINTRRVNRARKLADPQKCHPANLCHHTAPPGVSQGEGAVRRHKRKGDAVGKAKQGRKIFDLRCHRNGISSRLALGARLSNRLRSAAGQTYHLDAMHLVERDEACGARRTECRKGEAAVLFNAGDVITDMRA